MTPVCGFEPLIIAVYHTLPDIAPSNITALMVVVYAAAVGLQLTAPKIYGHGSAIDDTITYIETALHFVMPK